MRLLLGLATLGALALGCGSEPITASRQEACSPASCQALGKTCGAVPDGCGGAVECGSCPDGQACGAGGIPNVCATAATCEPTTCAAAGSTCGEIPDGCGATLACGSCPAGEACGAGGTPNVCGPRTGAVAWAQRAFGLLPNAGDDVVSVGSDARGNRYALATIDAVSVPDGIEGLLRFQRLDASGQVKASREWAFSGFSYFGMAVSPRGEIYLRIGGGCCGTPHAITFDARRVLGPAVVKLDSDGALLWEAPLPGWVQSVEADAAGAVVVTYAPASVIRLAPDGRTLWSRYLWWSQKACCGSPSGDVFCAEHLGGGDEPSGAPGAIRVARLAAADGTHVWIRDLEGLAAPTHVAAADDVVLLAATRAGTLAWGPARVTSGDAVFLALDAGGAPLWARAFEAGSRVAGLAVDAGGRAVLGVRPGGCQGHRLDVREADGAPSWSVRLPADGACAEGAHLWDIDLGEDGDVFVGGAIWEPLLLGTSWLSPRGQEGFAAFLAAP